MEQQEASRKIIVEVTSPVDVKPPPKSMVEKVSQYAAIFISILALFTTVYSAYLTRLHDRLSVKPNLDFITETGGR
jgi:hypothetical protein